MRRLRHTPWIHRKSRFIIAAIAAFGTILTAYLTIVKLAGASAICPTEGCDIVLNSSYATVFGLPLPLYGLVAYVVMGGMAIAPWLVDAEQHKTLRTNLEERTWQLMFAQSTAMIVFSGYLMYVMAAELKAFCLFCTGSALAALSLFVLTLIGRHWEDIGQLIFVAFGVGTVTIVGTLGVYASLHTPSAEASGGAEVALAEHLSETGAVMYGAYWCGHCQQQKELFGKEGFEKVNYVECDPKGENAQPELCEEAGVTGYPTWTIDGKTYSGAMPLEELADLSGYEGDRNFGKGAE